MKRKGVKRRYDFRDIAGDRRSVQDLRVVPGIAEGCPTGNRLRDAFLGYIVDAPALSNLTPREDRRFILRNNSYSPYFFK